MSEKSFATGGCLCGKVQYTLSNEPVRMAQCHCDHCRRSTGTGHISLAFFKKDDFEVTGETSHYTTTADDGARLTRHFCPECGSRLYGTNTSAPPIVAISVGCLDDSSWFKPKVIVYNKHKPVWDHMDTSVPTFEEMPPAPAK